MCIVVSLFLFPFAFAQDNWIYSNTQTIDIDVYENNIREFPPFTIEIVSNRNLTNIAVKVSDLHSEVLGKAWISGKIVDIRPSIFSLLAYKPTEISISMANVSETGDFRGQLTFYSDKVPIRTLPIEIRIFPNFYYQVTLIAIGVIFSLVIKFWKIEKDSKEAALLNLENAENAANLARREERFDEEYERGDQEFRRALKFITNGDNEQGAKILESSANHYRAARRGGDTLIQLARLTAEQMSELIDDIRLNRNGSIRVLLRKFKSVLFIIAAILVFVGIVEIWTRFTTDATSISTNSLWPVYAFLIGFGSQSLLGEVFEISRRRN